MTICSPYTYTKPIPTCVENIIVGSIADNNASLTAYIYNVTTKRITKVDGSSDGSGLATVDVSALSWSPNHTYVITLTLEGDDVNSLLNITIGSTITDQVALRFEEIFKTDGGQQNYTDVTLEVV